jgi:hypothetical protein
MDKTLKSLGVFLACIQSSLDVGSESKITLFQMICMSVDKLQLYVEKCFNC